MAKGYISLLSRSSQGFDGCEEFRQRSKMLPRRPQYIIAGNRKIVLTNIGRGPHRTHPDG